MVGYLSSSSVVSLKRPPNGASLQALPTGVAWCSSDDARVPSAARLTVCIYRERSIIARFSVAGLRLRLHFRPESWNC